MSQEVLQSAIFIIQTTTAHCTMKIDTKTVFNVTVTARVFLAENRALSAVAAVLIIFAVIIAERWRGW